MPLPDQPVAVHERAVERQAPARVRAPDVAADRAAPAVGVVGVGERVVAAGVGDDPRIGPAGRHRERRAVAPAAHDLRGQQLLAAPEVAGALGELAAERGDVLAQLAVDEVRPVDRELVGIRRDRQRALLVGVAEDELAGPDRAPAVLAVRRALARARLDAGALDGRLREAVGEPEVLRPVGERRAHLIDDDRQPAGLGRAADPGVVLGQRLLGLGADHHEHVDARVDESGLPALRRALARVAEQLRAGRHAVAELAREAAQRRLGEAERAQPGVRERQVDAGLGLDRPGGRGQHLVEGPGDPVPGLGGVGHPQQEVGGERQAVAAHHEPLDVGEVELAHSGNASLKRACRVGRIQPLRLEREGDQAGPQVQVGVHLGDRLIAVGGEEQRAGNAALEQPLRPRLRVRAAGVAARSGRRSCRRRRPIRCAAPPGRRRAGCRSCS